MGQHEEATKGKDAGDLCRLVDEVKEEVRKALSPTALLTRALLVLCPAAALCIVRLLCACVSGQCSVVSIRPRVFGGMLLSIPLAPLVHTTNASLGVDLIGWMVLSFGLTSYGTRFFVFGVLFLDLLSGSATWLVGSSAIVHAGTAGVLFGIFGFHLSILPFKRPLKWTDVASFFVFDVFYGGVWWGVHYSNLGYSHCLAYTGLLSGVLLAWLYFRAFGGSLETRDVVLAERLPLLHSGLDAMERATEDAVRVGSDRAVAGLGRMASAADRALADRTPALHRGIRSAGGAAGRATASAADKGVGLMREAGLGKAASGDRATAAGNDSRPGRDDGTAIGGAEQQLEAGGRIEEGGSSREAPPVAPGPAPTGPPPPSKR